MKPLVLDTGTKSIKAVLASAVSTTQPDWSSHYGESVSTAFSEKNKNGQLNGVTPVVLVAPPPSSKTHVVSEIIIFNHDTASVTVSIYIENTAGTNSTVWEGTLPPNGSWRLSDAGVASAVDGMRYTNPFVRASVESGVPCPKTEITSSGLYAMHYGGGNTYPRWAGSNFVAQSFEEIPLGLTTAHLAGSVYDGYLWLDGTTMRYVSGPAWASISSRGVGSGTAEMIVINGVAVNKFDMVVRNGATTYTMPARSGTLINTFAPSTAGELKWTKTSKETGNMYNRELFGFFSCPGYVDNGSETTWSMAPLESWQKANGGVGSDCKFVFAKPSLVEFFTSVMIKETAWLRSGVAFDGTIVKQFTGSNYSYLSVTSHNNNQSTPLSEGLHTASLCASSLQTVTFIADKGEQRLGAANDPQVTYISGSVGL